LENGVDEETRCDHEKVCPVNENKLQRASAAYLKHDSEDIWVGLFNLIRQKE
jgi:hypothetical protein